ncbi:MAG: hypothetical protein E6R10_07840 [Rhodocyclaceae bacterium]|nr:MAG: hypothetical protein E6R10_07840 [Rhodocyclaceae bacterium]
MSNGAVVFHKTAKGVEEMEKRCHGLTPKIRRVLIMIDGKRSVDALREMALADDLTHTIGALEEEGFIEVMGIAGARGVAPAPAGPLPSITAFKDESPPADPMRLQLSRNFMANTINAFCGALGNSSLLERLDAAHSLNDLRLCFDEWYQAIVSSRDGRREAEALRARLLDTI